MNKRLTLGVGKNCVTAQSYVKYMTPIKNYKRYNESNAYEYEYRKVSPELDRCMLLSNSDISVKLRRWLDSELETLMLTETISKKPVDMHILKGYADKVLAEENTPGLREFFERLADKDLYFSSGEKYRIVPELTWTDNMGGSDCRGCVRPVKLEGLFQIDMYGNKIGVYA